jgi:hypothetical protein
MPTFVWDVGGQTSGFVPLLGEAVADRLQGRSPRVDLSPVSLPA